MLNTKAKLSNKFNWLRLSRNIHPYSWCSFLKCNKYYDDPVTGAGLFTSMVGRWQSSSWLQCLLVANLTLLTVTAANTLWKQWDTSCPSLKNLETKCIWSSTTFVTVVSHIFVHHFLVLRKCCAFGSEWGSETGSRSETRSESMSGSNPESNLDLFSDLDPDSSPEPNSEWGLDYCSESTVQLHQSWSRPESKLPTGVPICVWVFTCTMQSLWGGHSVAWSFYSLNGDLASCSPSAQQRGVQQSFCMVLWHRAVSLHIEGVLKKSHGIPKNMTCSLLQRHMGTVPYTLAASHSLYLATKNVSTMQWPMSKC